MEADLKLLWSLGVTLSYQSSCSASQMLEVQMCVATPRCGLATQYSGHRNLYLPCSGVMVDEDRMAHYSPARTLKCLPSLGTENALKDAACVLQPHARGCHTPADKSVSWIQSTCDAFHFSIFFLIFLKYLFILFEVYECLPGYVQCCGVRRRHWTRWNRSYKWLRAAMCVLGPKPGSSVRAAGTINHWAISSAPLFSLGTSLFRITGFGFC